MGKSVSTGVPASPRDTYHVYLAIYVDSSQSAMFSAKYSPTEKESYDFDELKVLVRRLWISLVEGKLYFLSFTHASRCII